MKKINLILRKCKSLSRQLGRSYSYSSLRSKSARNHHLWNDHDHMAAREGRGGEDDDDDHQHQHYETIYAGSTRKRYVINSKYLKHPLLNALIERSNSKQKLAYDDDHGKEDILVKCEVVLFDHLLWMLENSNPILISGSLEELAEIYVF